MRGILRTKQAEFWMAAGNPSRDMARRTIMHISTWTFKTMGKKKEAAMSSSSTGQSENRVQNAVLAQRVMSGEEAAALIRPGAQIGMSGFTGSGYPRRPYRWPLHDESRMRICGPSRSRLMCLPGPRPGLSWTARWPWWCGAQMRLAVPVWNWITRKLINAGEMQYTYLHLSQVCQYCGVRLPGEA